MSRFIGEITKQDHVTKQKWGNRYIFEADDLATAHEATLLALDMEQAVHFDRVDFIHVRTSSQTEFDSVFISADVGGSGSQESIGKTLPLFCVVECTLGGVGGGRSGRKFYHTLFDDSSYDADGTIDDTYQAAFASAGDTFFSGLVDLGVTTVSPTGSKTYSNLLAIGEVKSHQFTKASKRTAPL